MMTRWQVAQEVKAENPSLWAKLDTMTVEEHLDYLCQLTNHYVNIKATLEETK